MTINLDLACGFSPKGKWIGLDIRRECQPDLVCNLIDGIPIRDSVADEINCSHFVEHLKPEQLYPFVRELWRVSKPDCIITLAFPTFDNGKTYAPEHSLILAEDWFLESALMKTLFCEINLFPTPSSLWESGAIQSHFGDIPFDLARKIFINMTTQMVIQFKAKK